MSGIGGVLLCSPNDGNISATDIDEHVNVHQMTLDENRAMLDSNGGDDHATRWSMERSAIGGVLLHSPNDGDIPATDIDEHANVHQMTLNENRAMLDSNGEFTGILDIQYHNLPNECLESQRMKSPTEIQNCSFIFRPPPRL
ncbi:hypothetical protein CY35_02G158300 [Sphagnum magellanicum]|nr:hypothetical protein CY35_02G158300 [Sphagnum magellanicum]